MKISRSIVSAMSCLIISLSAINASSTLNSGDPPYFIDPPDNMVITCEELQGLNFEDLDYTNDDADFPINGAVSPIIEENIHPICGGVVVATWTYDDPCHDPISHSQSVSVQAAGGASFVDIPPDLTVSCEEFNTNDYDLDLMYTNQANGTCEMSGLVAPSQTGNPDECFGGMVQMEWTFADPCGRIITHTRTITVLPAPETTYIDPPSDTTIDCSSYHDNYFQELEFTNGASGPCQFQGIVSPTITEDFDHCGGEVVAQWLDFDFCFDIIMHRQIVSIEAAEAPIFINPPADTIMECDTPLPIIDLDYSNGASGLCEISGTVSPNVMQEDSVTYILEWSLGNICNYDTITHIQVVTVCETTSTLEKLEHPARIQIFPNPVFSGQELNLVMDEKGDMSIKIMDLSGHLMLSQILLAHNLTDRNATVDLTNIEPGIYLIQVAQRGRIYSELLSVL